MAADLLGSTALLPSDLDERAAAKATLEAAEETLQSLCATYAGTFVAVERRGRALEQSLQDLLQQIQQVETVVSKSLQTLEQDSDEKESKLSVLSERHRVRRRTLLQHSSLLELLELPSLMDACVRSNLYDDALSIAAMANTLQRRHQDTNAVVTSVIIQIRSRQTDLRQHLLHRLRGPITMPECLECLTALRRLNSIDLERQPEADLERLHAAMEFSLQVDFLEARDIWVESRPPPTTMSSSALAEASRNVRSSLGTMPASQEPLLDVIERYRTRLFEVATQFNAIFRAQSKAVPLSNDDQMSSTSKQNSSVALLSMWISRRTYAFLCLLQTQLGQTTEASALRDALEASLFFASSMGRLGAAFTAQLPPVFEGRMHELVVSVWSQEGLHPLEETLRICREAGVASPLLRHQGLDENADEGELVETASESSPSGAFLGEPQPPPRLLLTFPPLARLVNAVLAGLNELRRCLLPGIVSDLRHSLEELLSQVEKELDHHDRAVHKPGLRGEASALRDAAIRYKEVFVAVVQPYLRGSLEAAIGNQDRAAHFHQIYWDSVRPKKPSIPEKASSLGEEEVAEGVGDVQVDANQADEEEEEAPTTSEPVA